MPMHDWTRVEACDYHDFHIGWIVAVSHVLNTGTLPDGYFALIEHTAMAAVKPTTPARRRVAVRHARGRELVAVIELVSPGNKASSREFRDLVDKSVQRIAQGISLLVVDPFPPTARDPHGLHAAIWKAATREGFAPPADTPLTLASYATANGECTAFVEPLAVGDKLRDMPLYLRPGLWVPVPLEATYRTAWDGFPKPLRPLLTGTRVAPE